MKNATPLGAKAPFWIFIVLLSFFLTPIAMRANDKVGFIEEFALAKDREAVLKQLIPGTEEYYYFHALHYQNEKQWERLAAIMDPWVKRYGETPQVWEIRNREALVRYPDDNKKTLDYLQQRLALQFNLQQERLDAKPDLPASLDQSLISWQVFLDQAMSHSSLLDLIDVPGLDQILRKNVDLNPARRRDLLNRLVYPDYEQLVNMIAADLLTNESRGFGEFKIHNNLLPSQLDELEKLRPTLAQDTNFIYTKIRKLHPNGDVDRRKDAAEREAYLNRVWSYVNTFDSAFNSLKAHVLYQLLKHHRQKGEYPGELWMTYLKLPRPAGYVEPRYLNSPEGRMHQVDLNANFTEITRCPPIGNDESLVREYLLQAFVAAENYEVFKPLIRDEYLKKLFAEAKLTAGVGNGESWYSLLTPSEVQELKERVDIEFAPTNQIQFLPGDEVKLNLDIKNVSDLVVKVYEVNALNYYLDQKRELNTDLNLDGLSANEEFKYQYDSPAIQRKRHTFEFKSLNKRGIWIIEFIGNGVSSRALVRKGQLQYLSRPTAAGTMVTVLDESNKSVKNPGIWFGGRQYLPDDKGRIILPFSQSGNQPIVLTDGDFASFETIELARENYTLQVGFHVEREMLLAGAEATVVVRPTLLAAGLPAPIDLLEDVKLTIRSTDLDGIASAQEVANFKLFDDRESVHIFRVPPRLRGLEFSISGKVAQVSEGGAKKELADGKSFEINGIDESGLVGDLHLSQVDGNYIIEVLGKSGEPLPDQGVNLTFDHRDFFQSISVSLKSDQSGKIPLGPLAGIERVDAESRFHQRTWTLLEDLVSQPASIHSRVGEVVSIALAKTDSKVASETFAILEHRKGTFVADHFTKGQIKNGLLEITGLTPGDYEVYLRDTKKSIQLKITGTETIESGYLLSKYRHLELGNHAPLQISQVTGDKDAIKLSVINASPTTRVHVFASRFLPEFSMARNLVGQFGQSLIEIDRGGYESRYLSGRDIGEEYRYIIERRGAKKFPGNMATRPGLILNPWALSDTKTNVADAAEGEAYKKSQAMDNSVRRPASASAPMAKSPVTSDDLSTNLDFLPSVAPILLNLKPGEDGSITLKCSDFADRQHIHVVAIDEDNLVYRQLALTEEKGMVYRDLRLKQSLDPVRHFTQRRRVTVLEQGEAFKIADIRSSEMETYDTLGGIYSVFSGIAADRNPEASKDLGEFSFILDWPTLKDERKRELYSKYACHELSFFLSRRDNEFFTQTIKPYLANKRDKTFLDHYLLGNDLASFLEPWKYGRLNIVERILLGRRLGGDNEKAMSRAVKDWFSLLPTNPEEADFRYRSALRGRRMAGSIGEELVVAGGGTVVSGTASFSGLTLSTPMAVDAFAAPPASPAREAQLEMVPAELPRRAIALSDVKELRKSSINQALFRKLDTTKEWAENNYYHLLIAQQIGDLINVNDFWKDYAEWNGAGGFYSRHFPAATGNFAEMMLALAVMDLPFSAKAQDIKIENESLTITANSPVVVFHEEIEERAPAGEKSDILITQNFFRADDRFQVVEGVQIDKFVTKEFLTGIHYGCQVVITNPTSSQKKLDLLFQLPQGSVPLESAEYTRTFPIDLGPFSTEKLEVSFYFPKPSGGEGFAHYPVHIAKNEQPIAWSEPFRFTVVNVLTEVDKASWEYLSQFGTNQQVLDFLEQNNVHLLNLDRIAWRMKSDVDFFRKAVTLLRNRHAYSDTIWSYSILHNETSVIREYLTHQESFLQECGKQLECEIVSINPIDRHWYQHLEYTPLVNARVHRLGRDKKILNNRFHDQYHQYMTKLGYTSKLTATDQLGVAYYLFLQDRIEEGLEWFAALDVASIESKLQYDYLKAYAALYREEPAIAAELAGQYKNYGVDRWRERFALIGDHVREIQGANPNLTDGEDREQRQDHLASKQPVLDLKTEGAKVALSYQNLASVTLNYYEMDLEFLFSSQPFVSAGSGQFSYIRPNLTEQLALPAGQSVHEFEIPQRFSGKNVLVEAVASGQKRSSAVYANTLKVQMAENYGRLQVRKTNDDTPLPKTYVKVYARFKNGEVKFFKDGYTDLRGKFDYVSLSTDEMSQVDRFSVLIMSENDGAVVREVAPPQM